MKEHNILDSESLVELAQKDYCDVSNLIVEGAESDIFLATNEFPRTIGGFAYCICIAGECDIVLDKKGFRLQPGNLCSVFPNTLLQTVYKSPDFKAYIHATDSDLLPRLTLPSSTEVFLFMKDNPCISITEEEQQTLFARSQMVSEYVLHEEHPYRQQLVEQSVLLICYEIAGIYQKREPLAKKDFSRKDLIFRNFVFSLAQNYKKHRTVEYYASEQCISTRHFSSIIKEVSGQNATDYIAECVVMNAKILISSTQMSIQEIADELNFINPSFFGSYFKRHTGMTPMKYRHAEKH